VCEFLFCRVRFVAGLYCRLYCEWKALSVVVVLAEPVKWTLRVLWQQFFSRGIVFLSSFLTACLRACTVSPAPGKHRRQRSVDDTDTAELLILNSDFRAALVAALSGLDELEDGRLSIEQFAAILTQLIGVNGVSVVTLLMGR
jgi:hypothetical protein